ncbi:MAG: hypothetical protein AAF517_15045, partial [Planctomycetota bacterium]
MSTRKHRLSELAKLCSDLGPEDGLDPRDFFDRRQRGNDAHRTRRLCSQVARSIGLDLASSPNDIVSTLSVVAVTPSPDSAHLLVVTEHENELDVRDSADVL